MEDKDSVHVEDKFPCSIVIDVPFPDHRLASTALRAIQVDEELSSLVRRTFSLVGPPSTDDPELLTHGTQRVTMEPNILRTEYRATTNRMLRVAVNGFMESLRVVLEIIQELDVEVLASTQVLQQHS